MTIDVGEKISRMRTLIVEATRRLDKDGCIVDGNRKISLLVQQGELSYFSRLSKTGPSKIYVELTFRGENLIFSFCRIYEDETTIEGVVSWDLPRLPLDLDKATLPLVDPHFDHSVTAEDVEEIVRWTREGETVDSNYLDECFERGMKKLLGIVKTS